MHTTAMGIRAFMSADRLVFLLNRFRERLWIKPLIVCLLSIAAVFAAKIADTSGFANLAPIVTAGSIESLLKVMASSMLVIATFAVGSMVSAYATASGTATPRAFRLVVADDVSQNALSTFIGAFIFSLVALTAVMNDFFARAGRFSIFVLTLLVFGVVIFTFVRWVDRIARLGRLETAIEKVESATANAMRQRQRAPRLCGVACDEGSGYGQPIYSDDVGYVQHVDMAALQACAQSVGARLVLVADPGTFVAPGQALVHIRPSRKGNAAIDAGAVRKAFMIGAERYFDNDPRFGLIVLSEIAGRALSPGINDPGTAIGIIGAVVRLLVLWSQAPGPEQGDAADQPSYDRIEVPLLSVHDMFDDAFTSIGRDGAPMVDVSLRLQKSLASLAMLPDPVMRQAAARHARMALARCESAMSLPLDLERVRHAAAFAQAPAAN
jgi:uncharacterized membrane protein